MLRAGRRSRGGRSTPSVPQGDERRWAHPLPLSASPRRGGPASSCCTGNRAAAFALALPWTCSRRTRSRIKAARHAFSPIFFITYHDAAYLHRLMHTTDSPGVTGLEVAVGPCACRCCVRTARPPLLDLGELQG